MTETELLAVLDMSEDEQDRWCVENTEPGSWAHLADLAFRLRDEVLGKEKFWYGNLHIVYCHVKNMNVNYNITPGRISQYFLFEAKPIHWIIAALIAKDKDNDR